MHVTGQPPYALAVVTKVTDNNVMMINGPRVGKTDGGAKGIVDKSVSSGAASPEELAAFAAAMRRTQ